MGFPVLGSVVAAGGGFVDGVISGTDADAGRTEWFKQWATYYAGLLAVGGIAMGYLGANHELYEPAMYLGAGLLARRGGFALIEMQQAKPVQAYGRVAAAPRVAHQVSAGYQRKQVPSVVG